MGQAQALSLFTLPPLTGGGSGGARGWRRRRRITERGAMWPPNAREGRGRVSLPLKHKQTKEEESLWWGN